MSTATDSLQIAKQLKNLKFTEEQAEGLAEIVAKVDERNRSDLVTKDYFEAKLYRALFIHGLTLLAAILAASKLL